VLLDVRLGDLNGSDVCWQRATVAPTARIVMLIAYDDAGNLRRCLEVGAAGVLLKGTRDLDLVQALPDFRMVIDGSRRTQLETALSLLDEASPYVDSAAFAEDMAGAAT
jgi:two-component system response regulator DesR